MKATGRKGLFHLLPILSVLLLVPYSLHSACRDMDLARRLTSFAYAAEPDATIQYFGHNFFSIVTAKGTRLITDPLAPGWYPMPKIWGHVVTVGREHFNHNYVALVQGDPVILRGLAYFGADWNRINMTVRDVFIYNIPIYQNGLDGGALKGAAFLFDLGTLCIAHLGDLSHPLTPQQIKRMGRVDIALTPIDGRFTMGPDIARQVLGQLKPKIAIPMHFRDQPHLVQEFSQGFKVHYLSDTVTVTKASLPASTEIMVLKPWGARGYE